MFYGNNDSFLICLISHNIGPSAEDGRCLRVKRFQPHLERASSTPLLIPDDIDSFLSVYFVVIIG
jgi:hypothetical protein